MHPLLLTTLAMLAFAANSVLCRLALAGENIDAASFTEIRLLSGAITLALIVLIQQRKLKPQGPSIYGVLMLFCYAISFSFSYVDISTGTGALILFGTVQLTMIGFGLFKGERPSKLAWSGIVLALGGFTYLLLPGVTAPPLHSALLMIVAGLAWAIYTLIGRGVQNPLQATTWNFIGTLPLVLVSYLIFQADAHISQQGVLLAILSGALASGIGYAIWYSALPQLTATLAATVQLTVPVIATMGGVALMAEVVDMRLVIASVAVLGGVFLTIRYR